MNPTTASIGRTLPYSSFFEARAAQPVATQAAAASAVQLPDWPEVDVTGLSPARAALVRHVARVKQLDRVRAQANEPLTRARNVIAAFTEAEQQLEAIAKEEGAAMSAWIERADGTETPRPAARRAELERQLPTLQAQAKAAESTLFQFQTAKNQFEEVHRAEASRGTMLRLGVVMESVLALNERRLRAAEEAAQVELSMRAVIPLLAEHQRMDDVSTYRPVNQLMDALNKLTVLPPETHGKAAAKWARLFLALGSDPRAS